MAAPPNNHKGALFSPPEGCTLVRLGLSGPGVVAMGDTRAEAKYQLLKLEEMLSG